MKNFVDRIEFIIEPWAYKLDDGYGEIVQLRIKCIKNGRKYSKTEIKDADFFKSHYDIVIDYIKESLKEFVLSENDNE
jgi:hypothetical protein